MTILSLLSIILITSVSIFAFNPNISCHVCIGGEGTPCTEDPKSTQSLTCSDRQSYLLPRELKTVLKGRNATRYLVSCLAISWRKSDRGIRFVRTCLKSPWGVCRKLEGILLDTDNEFLSCRQCIDDFCNCKGIVSNFKSVTVLATILSVIIFRKT